MQGDASLYTTLAQMGCTATQTRTHTTVRGPKVGSNVSTLTHTHTLSPLCPCALYPFSLTSSQVLRGVNVDMSEQTDCFMTIAAVAAVAEGVTRITNIANQRMIFVCV